MTNTHEVSALASGLATQVKVAAHSWFSASHVALLVSGAAVVVTIVVSIVTIWYTRKTTRAAVRNALAAEDSAASARVSAKASEDSAASAKVSAKASVDSAQAAKDLLGIERDREYDRVRPKLRGRLVPEPGNSGPTNAWLEVLLDGSTPWPLRTILLTVPAGVWFARGNIGRGPTMSQNDFGFPESSGRTNLSAPGNRLGGGCTCRRRRTAGRLRLLRSGVKMASHGRTSKFRSFRD